MADKKTRLLLEVGIDKKYANDSAALLKELKQKFDALKAQNAQGGTVAQNRELDRQLRVIQDIIAEIKFQESPIKANLDAQKKVTEELERQKRAQQEIAAVPASPRGSSGGGGGRNALQSGESLFREFGGLGRSVASGDLVGIAQDAFGAAQAAQAANVSAAALGASAGLVAAAFTGVVVAAQPFLKILRDGQAALTAATNSQKLYYETLTKGTTTSVQDQIKAAEEQKRIADNTIRDLENARRIGAESGGIFGDFLVRLGDLTGQMGGASAEEIQKLKDEALQAQFNINALNAALDSSAIAANDAAEAQKKLNDFIVSDTIRAANVELNYRRQLASYSTQSSDQLRSTGDALKQQIADQEAYIQMLQSSTGNNEELAKAMNDAEDELATLRDLYAAVTGTLLQNAEAHERQKKAAEDAKKALEDSAKAFERLKDITTDILELNSARKRQLEQDKREDERAGIVADFQARIAAAKQRERAAESEAKITDLRKKASQREQKATRDYNADRRKLGDQYMADDLKRLAQFIKEEKRANDEYAKQRVRDLEDLNDDLVSLAADRDVAGFVARRKEGEKQLRRQAEDAQDATRQRLLAFADERAEAMAAYQQRLADLRTSYEQERAERQQQLNADIETERARAVQKVTESDRLEKELSDLRARWQREDELRQRDLQRQEFEKRLAKLKEEAAKTTEIMLKPFRSAITWATSAISAVQQLISKVKGVSSGKPTGAGKSSGVQPLPSFDKGTDFVERDGLAFLHKGERVVTARENRNASVVGKGRGVVLYYQPQVVVGDIASKSDIESAMQADHERMIAALSDLPVVAG